MGLLSTAVALSWAERMTDRENEANSEREPNKGAQGWG